MPPLVVPIELRRALFRGSSAVARGLLTPDQLRARPWQRLFPGVYAGPDVVVSHRTRARAAAGLVVTSGVVTGRSAATLWGVPLREAWDDVELTVPPGTTRPRVRGLVVRHRALPAGCTTSGGDPVGTTLQTVLDLAARRPEEDAVIDVDRFLSSRDVPVGHRTTVLAARAAAAGFTGRDCRHLRAVLTAADGLAESPQETRVRRIVHASALPRPVAQFDVHHAGRWVARVDFAWPEHRVALEYDGLWHRDPAQFARDRARLNRLTAAGWRVVFVTAADLRSPAALVARIAHELAR